MKYFSFILILSNLFFLSCKDKPAKGLGLTHSNTFHPCPKSQNCVSSFEDPNDETHYIKPIKYFLPKETTIKKIRKIIQDNPRAKIVESSDIYIRAEYTSSIFSFVDDIQLYFGAKNIIHVKSASRVGFSDFGKNRERVREIEFALQQSGL
jgi:uncharacterized protein (DUF1499 family)